MKGKGPTDCRILIVGEQPSVRDLRSGRPFGGGSGEELYRMLHDAGIIATECYMTYFIKDRTNGIADKMFGKNKTESKKLGLVEFNGKYPTAPVLVHLRNLWEEIASIKPNLVIAIGEHALWALTGNSGITKWRGSVLEGLPFGIAGPFKTKVIPTYSPSKIRAKWAWRWIAVQDLRRAERESHYPEIRYPDYNFEIRPSFTTVTNWINTRIKRMQTRPETRSPDTSPDPHWCNDGYKLSVDIETRCGHIACIGFADSPLDALCVPLMCTENEDGYWSIEEEIAIILAIREMLTHVNACVFGQNFLYDCQYIAKSWGYIPNVKHDTMYEHHVAFAGMQKGLDFLSSIYCDFHRYWKDEGKEWNPSISEDNYWVYNCKDAVATYECSEAILATIEALNLEGPRAMQMRLFKPVLRMMLRGIRIDESLKAQFGMELLEARAVREQWLMDVAEGTVLKPKSKTAKMWFNSPKQLGTFLYDTLNMPEQLKRATGKRTTDDTALQKLRKREPALRQFFDTLAELRSIGVFFGTFVNARLDHDKRMRCSFNPAGTETFRFNSSADAFGFGTNLQNIPKGTEDE